MRPSGLRDFLLWWNGTFKYDYLYRKRFGIGFGSPEHRALNQIDIYLFFLEERLIKEALNKKVDPEVGKRYQQGHMA